jgi:hypothetical protein
MQQAKLAPAITILLSATAFSAAAQEGDIADGHAFAREACKLCQIVDPDDHWARGIVIGPGLLLARRRRRDPVGRLGPRRAR